MEHRLLYPVGRHLTAITIAYLSGVALSCYGTIPAPAAWTLCLAGIAVGLFRFFTDKRALLYFALAFFALGNCLAGSEFAIVDEPTQPNTLISGTVLQIESDYRVMLGDVVCAPGKQMKRPVMVTLMIKEDEPAPQLPLVGQRITGTGRLFSQDEIRNPGGREKRIDAINRGYELSGYLLSGWEASGEQRFSLSEAFRQMRLRLTACFTRIFGKDAPLFLAVILGNREAIDSDLNAAMRLTGTAHILSVSGMHLNLISAALSVVLGIFPIERKGKRFIHIVVLVLFTGLTGCAVGTMRALLMTIIRMAAPVCGRRYDRLTALSFSALLITLIRPLMFFDGGFRFSFFVVLGIVLLQQPIAHLKPMRRLHGRAPWFAQMLEVSIAAQLSAIPYAAGILRLPPVVGAPHESCVRYGHAADDVGRMDCFAARYAERARGQDFCAGDGCDRRIL